jgi:hypothetical protein
MLLHSAVQPDLPDNRARRASVQASQWGQSTFDHLLGWAEDRATPSEVVRDADVVLAGIRLRRAAGRDREVVRLGRAVEGPLIAARRWGQWQLVLQSEMAAAVAAASVSDQAWAYHQLGSRSLGLGDTAAARQSLNEALQIRQSIGDRVGTGATRHNLDLAGGAPPGPTRDGGWGRRTRTGTKLDPGHRKPSGRHRVPRVVLRIPG